MAIHVFLICFGSLLACSIALAVAVKKLAGGFATGGKRPFLYSSFSAIITSLLAYLASFTVENPFSVYWILGAAFLLLGIIQVTLIHNRYFLPRKKGNRHKALLAEVLFGLSTILFTLVIFSSLRYFLKDDLDFLFYPVLMSTLLFFVPLFFQHTFRAALAIPPPDYPTWQYPLQQPIDLPEEDPDEKKVVIGFEIAKKAADRKRTYFRARAPETMKLGELFYHFINDYNDQYQETAIEHTNADFEPFEWLFYPKRKWYQPQRILNPDYSIRENGITENTVVICERFDPVTSVSNIYNHNYYEG